VECSYCFHHGLHSSRFRAFDLFHLLILQVPMRCNYCRFRQFKNVFSVRAYKKNRKTERKAA
jgi:hypothetical protein